MKNNSKKVFSNYDLKQRRELSNKLLSTYQDHVPVIVEFITCVTDQCSINKHKYLVPSDSILCKFYNKVIKEFNHDSSIPMYIMTSKNKVLAMDEKIYDIFFENKDSDGFLYLTFSTVPQKTYDKSISRRLSIINEKI
jgi:hypothetical protein